MSIGRLISFKAAALLAFASNSLLCRAVLQHTPIDAASFTAILGSLALVIRKKAK